LEWSGPPGWRLGTGLTTQPRKKTYVQELNKKPRIRIKKTKIEAGNQKYLWVHGTSANNKALERHIQ